MYATIYYGIEQLSRDLYMQVSETIIDFHLVEKCRTKFRAFVKGFGAKVRFDPVTSTPRKQEYHGTVTVTRACKQQFLTNYLQVLLPHVLSCGTILNLAHLSSGSSKEGKGA